MRFKCIRLCEFLGRHWQKGSVCEFGKIVPPHHFIRTDEIENTELPKSRIDIQSGVVKGVKASSFYEVAKHRTNTNVGFASTLEKDEVIHDSKQFKRR